MMPLYIGKVVEQVVRTAKLFRDTGALSPETAKTTKQLGLDNEFENQMKTPIGLVLPFVKVGRKYYLSEEHFKLLIEEAETMAEKMQKVKWLQHTASVPKGYLRVRTLQMLKERPMSGSEIGEAITKETDGRWRPNPGSIYPLLRRLSQSGFTKEIPSHAGPKKRYCLTEEGERFLEENADFIEKVHAKFGPFASSVIGSGSFPFDPMESLPDSLVESVGRLMRLFFELRGAWTKSSDDKFAKDLTRLFDELSGKLDSLLESYRS